MHDKFHIEDNEEKILLAISFCKQITNSNQNKIIEQDKLFNGVSNICVV